MKNIVVSVATALAIAVGSFGTVAATTGSASADTRIVIRENGVRIDNGRSYRRDYRKRRHVERCRVVVTKKVVWRNNQRRVIRVKDRRCW